MKQHANLIIYLRKFGFELTAHPDKWVGTDGTNLLTFKRGKLTEKHYMGIKMQMEAQGYDVQDFDAKFLTKKPRKVTNDGEQYEVQFDLKPTGAVIRINTANGCIFRMCQIPKDLVFDEHGNVREFIDFAYPHAHTQNDTVVLESPTARITASQDVLDRIAKTVDIQAPKNTKVRLHMKDGKVWGGYDGDKKRALQYLKPDVIYHVLRTDVQNWTTDIYLQEFPEIGFNSVMFEHVKD